MCNVNVSLSAQFIRFNSDCKKHPYTRRGEQIKRTLSVDIECDSVFPSTHLLSYLVACVHIQCRAAILLLTWCLMSFPPFDMVRREIRRYAVAHRNSQCDLGHIMYECDVIAVAFYWFDFCCWFNFYFRFGPSYAMSEMTQWEHDETKLFFLFTSYCHTNEMNGKHTLERNAIAFRWTN